MTSKNINNKDIENKLKNILSFEDDEEKLEFETDMINLMIISKLNELMEQNNINKKELAERLGTSKSYVTQLFNGDKILNLKILAKFQRIFKTTFKFDINEYNDENCLFQLEIPSFYSENVKKDEEYFKDNIISFSNFVVKNQQLCQTF